MQIMGIWLLFTFENKSTYTAYAALAILVYGGFIILEIRSLSERIDLDNYIMASFTLYIDLMTLFIYLLAIFGKKK